MTGRGIPQRKKLSSRLYAPARNFDGKALYFRERQKFSLSQPYLDADIAIKVLAADMIASGSGGDREMVGEDEQPTIAQFRFDPYARRKPGQVLKLHTTFKEATTPGDGPNWGWVDPKPELSDEERIANMKSAAEQMSKEPQLVLRRFTVDENGNDTGQVSEVAIKQARQISVKQLGPTIRDMMPTESIDVRRAIAKGIVIDANGRMRCPPGTPNANQFTDMDMSNCFMFGLNGVQREIRRIRGFWKEWNDDVAAVRAQRTAKERLQNAKENYTSPDENAEILAKREESFNDALITLGIDPSQFTPEQLKQNVHLFSALNELFDNHNGPEFRRFLHDAPGFTWDDTKTVDENMKNYWGALESVFETILPDEIKKALLIDPNTKQPLYPDQYREARATLDMIVDRHRQVQEGIIRAALISFNDNPQMFETLREIGFDSYQGGSLADWLGGEAITNPLGDDVSPGRLGTQINVNTWALTFSPLVDMGLLTARDARFELDMKPVDADGTPLSDVERLKRIRDVIANSVEVAHFVGGVDFANQQSSARASAVSGLTPTMARAQHVMFHEFGHVLQYAEAQNSIIDYVDKHGQIVVKSPNGQIKVLSGDWRNWSNEDWYAAQLSVMKGTFNGVNYPPVSVDWLEDSMLHLLAGKYYQNELSIYQDMVNRGASQEEVDAQLGLMIQEARAELYALRQMGVIRGEDVDKAIGGMDSATRPPGIDLASRPIYDAPTENRQLSVPRSIFAGKRDYSRRRSYDPKVQSVVREMTKEGFTPEQILNELNSADPDNPKYSIDDVTKMIGTTKARDMPSWMSPERSDGSTPVFDPDNGIYADWSPEPSDDRKLLKDKNFQAEQDYQNSDDFRRDMEEAGYDPDDDIDKNNLIRDPGTGRPNKVYSDGLKKYKERYAKPGAYGKKKTTPASTPDSGTASEPDQPRRDIPKWEGQKDVFEVDFDGEARDKALIDDYRNTDYSIDELAERYDTNSENIQRIVNEYEKTNGKIERKNTEVAKTSPSSQATPQSDPKTWGRSRREQILESASPETVALFDGSIPPEKRDSARSLTPKGMAERLSISAKARTESANNAETISAPTPDAESPLLPDEIRDAIAPMLFHIDSHQFDEDIDVSFGIGLPSNYEVGGGELVTVSTPIRGILIGDENVDKINGTGSTTRPVRLTVPSGSRGVVDGNRFNGDSDGIVLPPGRIVLTGIDENGVITARIDRQETPAETLGRMTDSINDILTSENVDDSVKTEGRRAMFQIMLQLDSYNKSGRGQGMRSRSRGTSNDVFIAEEQNARNNAIANIMRSKNSAPFNIDNNYAARHRNPDGSPLSTQWGNVLPREVQIERRNGRIASSIGRMSNIINGDIEPSSEAELDFINSIDPRVKKLMAENSPEEIQALIDDAYVKFHQQFDDRVRVAVNQDTLDSLLSDGRLKTIQELKPNSPISKLKSDHELYLGYDPKTSNGFRSISGYMSHRNASDVINDYLASIPSDGVIRDARYFHESGDVQPMGDVRLGGNDIDIVLKPEVAQRSAYTRGDAIRSHNYPTPILSDEPGDVGSAHLNESTTRGGSEIERMRNIASALQNVVDDNFSGALSDDTSISRAERSLKPGNRYEALIAGGVQLSDIAEIRFPVNKLDTDSEELDIASIIGNSGQEFLKNNGFSDGELKEYLKMIENGEVDLQSAKWLKQHRAAKKFEKEFKSKNNFDGKLTFTNPDGIDLLSPSTFSDHPTARGLSSVEQMLSARMLDDMAPNLKKTLRGIRKSPDAQARIRAAKIEETNKPTTPRRADVGNRSNIDLGDVDDVFNELTSQLANIEQNIDSDDSSYDPSGFRSSSRILDSLKSRLKNGNVNWDDWAEEQADNLPDGVREDYLDVVRGKSKRAELAASSFLRLYSYSNLPGSALLTSAFDANMIPESRDEVRELMAELRYMGESNPIIKNLANNLIPSRAGSRGMRSRSLPSPKTFNDYVENPPTQGMRSRSGLEVPKYPRKPTMGAFIGSADSDFDEAQTWDDFKKLFADKEVVFIDYETTGLKFNEFNESAGNGAPTQIGAVKVKNGEVIDRFNVFVNPGMEMSEWEQWSRDNLKDADGNPITDEFLSDKPSIRDAHRQLVNFIGNTELLGMQNAVFDNEVLEDALRESGINWRPKGIIDTKELSDMVLPKWSEENPNGPFGTRRDGTKYPSNSLGDITKFLGVELGDKHHTADADAEATAEVMQKIIDGAIENGWSSDVLNKSKRRAKEQANKDKFEKALASFEEAKKTFIDAERAAGGGDGLRSRTATKPASKRTSKPKPVEPRKFRNPETEALPSSPDYYNVDDIENAMQDIVDDVYSGLRNPQTITNRVNALRDEIRELGSSSGMPDDMIEDLLDGTSSTPIAKEASDIVGGYDRWGGLRSRSAIGKNARTKAGVAGRIISSDRSRRALEKLGVDEDRVEAVQLLGEMAAAFSVGGPGGLGAVLARRAGRDVADFGLAEAVERGWIDQETADKISRRMLDRVAPEGLPDDIKDIIEKGKNSITSEETKARAAELLETLRETVNSGGMKRLISLAGERTRTLTDAARERGRELASERMRDARSRAREKVSDVTEDTVDRLKERGKEATGKLVGRFRRRGE